MELPSLSAEGKQAMGLRLASHYVVSTRAGPRLSSVVVVRRLFKIKIRKNCSCLLSLCLLSFFLHGPWSGHMGPGVAKGVERPLFALWVQALALLREMPGRRLEPSAVSYSASVSVREMGAGLGIAVRDGRSKA